MESRYPCASWNSFLLLCRRFPGKASIKMDDQPFGCWMHCAGTTEFLQNQTRTPATTRVSREASPSATR